MSGTDDVTKACAEYAKTIAQAGTDLTKIYETTKDQHTKEFAAQSIRRLKVGVAKVSEILGLKHNATGGQNGK